MSSDGDMVAGRNAVVACLQARKRAPRKLYCQAGAKGLGEIRNLAGRLAVEERDRGELDRLAAGVLHQGVVLEADPLPVHHIKEWSQRGFGPDAMVVVLDGIEDPHNLGAVVRSAAACGAAGVVFGKDRTAPLSPAAVKAASGGMEYVDLVQATNLVRGLKQLKDNGFWVAGFEADAETVLWDGDLSGRMTLVIGSEGRGMRRLVRETCDLYLRIPLCGTVTSLNASVSAGIVLAECMRQRRIA